jgi:hypothetical protein
MDPSEYSHFDWEYFFEECYEEYVLEQIVREKLKAFSDDLEKELDRIQAEIDEEDEQRGHDT